MTPIVQTDIDIDFANRDAALMTLGFVPASRIEHGEVVKHQTGVYFQDAPVDPITGLCSILYEDASDLGYFKVDLLNNSIYDGVRDEDHLDQLINREPEWSLLEEREIVGMLAHVKDHFGTVRTIRPKSIEDLSVVLALIRPAKKYLVHRPRAEIEAEIWKPEVSDDGYKFKRAHAIAYAVSIVVQLNLLVEKTIEALEQEEPLPEPEHKPVWGEDVPDWV